MDAFRGSGQQLSSLLLPLLQKVLHLPFNTLLLISQISADLKAGQSVDDFKAKSFLFFQQDQQKFPIEIYGSHCLGLCQFLLELALQDLPNFTAKGIICPSWYASQSRDEMGHVALAFPFIDNNSHGYVLLDPGLKIPVPIVLTEPGGVCHIPGYDFQCLASGLIQAQRNPPAPNKPNFIYDVKSKFNLERDSWTLLRSMLQRQQYSIFFRSVPGLIARECLIGIDFQGSDSVLFFDDHVIEGETTAGVSSNLSRMDRCQRYSCSSDERNNSLLLLGGLLPQLFDSNWKDLFELIDSLFTHDSLHAITTLRIMISSPFSSLRSLTASLTSQQLLQFQHDGYILLRSIIPIELIDLCLSEIQIMLSESLIEGTSTHTSAGGGIAPAPKYRSSVSENRLSTGKLIYNVDSDLIWTLLSETPVRSLAQSLFHDKELRKPDAAQLAIRFPLPMKPFQEEEEPLGRTNLWRRVQARQEMTTKKNVELVDHRDHWHIDGQWESNIPQFSLLVGVYLTPCPTSGYGNFTAFPGSHRRVQSMLAEDFEGFCAKLRTKVAPDLSTSDDRPPVELIVNPGDVLLAHPLLAHRAGENWSSQIRHAVYFRLMTTSFGEEVQNEMIRDLYCEMPPLRTLLPATGAANVATAAGSAVGYPLPVIPSWSPRKFPSSKARVYLVTGANRGIGLATCVQLLQDASMASTSSSPSGDVFLFVGCRSLEKIQMAFDSIHAALMSEATRSRLAPLPPSIGLCGLIIDLKDQETMRSAAKTIDSLSSQVWQSVLLSSLSHHPSPRVLRVSIA
jgi:hypothetical protein